MSSIVIAISGEVCSGKSTVSQRIARAYGLRCVSIGSLFRRIAEERGISLMRLHEVAESDESIDKLIDGVAVEEARRGNAVVEGHLAGWILKDLAHVKIYLKADVRVRARRLAERDGKTVEEALREIVLREEMNRRRYLKIYNIDIRDLSVFDIVLDTTYLALDDVVTILKTFINCVLSRRRMM